MRFRKEKEEQDPRVGITPLIDVVFLLLIFFMVTSHFHVASGVQIRLPQVSRRSQENTDKNIVLVVDREGGIYLKDKKIKVDQLDQTLRDIVKNEGTVSLVLEADKEVQHGQVVNIMDISKRSGVSSIIIAARWVSE